MKIYLDDERPVPDGYVGVRTVEDAFLLLNDMAVEEISLDHDLGTEQTGYDVVLYLERRVANETNYLPPRMVVHSANPVGKARMEQAIKKMWEMIDHRIMIRRDQ